MDFTQNESQRELAALSRRILTERLTPHRLAPERLAADGWRPRPTGRFDPALWADLADAGVLAAALPEALGGAGLGLLEQCSVLTEIGRAVAPRPLPGLDRARRQRTRPVRHRGTSSTGGRRRPAAAS